MSNYRKKDTISDLEIESFETIEINKIKQKYKKKSIFKNWKVKLLIPVTLFVAFLGISIMNNPTPNPLLEDINLAEFNSITINDLPTSLRGVEDNNLASIQYLSNKQFLSSSITFENEDVTGEGQQTLTDIINDQNLDLETKKLFEDLYKNIQYLTLDEVSIFEEVNEYYFVINEDGTYTLTMKMNQEDQTTIIEALTFYESDEFFYQVTMEVLNDNETTNIFKVKYNQDNSVKMQYAMHKTNDATIEQYVYVEQTEETTNVVATNEVNGEKYEIVGKANDSHGVIFSNYTSNDVSYISTEYYDGNGSLLKQEQGFDSLDVFDESLNNLYIRFEQNEEVELKNLSSILSGFDHPESFTVEVLIEDAALAVTSEVSATLKVNDLETYDINYSYNNLFYTKESETFVSGDTLYHLTNQEMLNDKVVLTYSALYQVPNGYVAPNDIEYYVVNKYMANYIQASAGYEIILENGVYKLKDLENEGKPGSKIDIEIKEEQYYSNDELVNVTMFEHTCDIQFENLIFTKLDTVNNAKTDLELLYDELVPTSDQMEQFNISIDTSMFE